MDNVKVYAMLLLVQLVIAGGIFYDPYEGRAADTVIEGGGDVRPFASDLVMGPQYPGSTLHVGAGQTYATIQAAQDASVDGDTIVVHPGKYTENVIIDTAVHLRGMRGAIIEGSNAVGIRVSTSNVTITGIQVNSSNNGIYATSMGLNVSDCTFYRNSIDIRIEVINNTLTRDFLGYPLEIINNTIDHASTTNTMDITITLGANWGRFNITVGQVTIARNKVTNNQNRGYHVRVRETVGTVHDSTVTLGEFSAFKNNLTAMEYGIYLQRSITDLDDVDLRIGSTSIEDNWVTNPRTIGIQVTNSFTRVIGVTKCRMGETIVKGNRIVSSSIGGGITINPGTTTQFNGPVALTIGDLNVSSNYVNVSGRALYININQPMNSAGGNASLKIGNITVWMNDLVSRANNCVNYALSTLSLNYNTSATFGRLEVLDNKVVSSLSQGVVLSLTDISSSMTGNSVLTHGGFQIRSNNIRSSSYSTYLTFTRVGKGVAGSSMFSMDKVRIENNVMTGSNGARVIMSDTLTYGDGRSRTTLGDLDIRANTIKSTAQSVYVSLTNIASHNKGNSFTRFGNMTIAENAVQSNTDGAYIILDTIGADMADFASSKFGNLAVENNILKATTYGIQLVRVRYVGETMYDNSTVWMGKVSLSDNELPSGNGVQIGLISNIGHYLQDNSTFEMGGLWVNGNNITSLAGGINIGTLMNIGDQLFGSARSRIGDVRLCANKVMASGSGIYVATMSTVSSDLLGSTISEMGSLQVDDNIISSGGIGMSVGVFGRMGTAISGSSLGEMKGMSISGNYVNSGDTGITLGTAYFLGCSISEDGRTKVGAVVISDNTISSDTYGIYVESYDNIGCENSGHSNSSIGGLRISNNTVTSERFGLFVGSTYIMGTRNMNNSWTEIGDISFDGNTIVSNTTGLYLGIVNSLIFECTGNSTVHIGCFSFDHNTISANGSAIHVPGGIEMLTMLSDNVTTTMDGVTFDDNIIDCTEFGILVPEVHIGLQMTGRSKAEVGPISSSGNRMVSGGGLSIVLNVTEHYGNSSLTIGSLDLDRNVIEGSEGNGIALDLSFWTLENSTFLMGSPSISDNRLIDVNWSAVRVVRKVNISEDSTFVLGGLELVHNNMTRCSLGLNLTGCGFVGAYLNNFIGNEVDVLSDEGTSVTWYSPKKMWYRHKNANHSYFLGNYWDRYSGPDADDNGIGDVPYNTDYGLDLYPLSSNVDDHFPPWNDVTPPSVTILFPTNGSYLRQTQFTLNYSVSDNLQGFREISVILDGHQLGGRAERDLSDPDTVIRMSIIASEGVHTIEIRAVDMAGNENSTSSTFMVDVTDPVMTLVSPQDGTFLGSNDIELVWEGSDIPSGLDRFEVKFGSWEWIDVGTERNYTFSDVAEGEHLVQVRAWDRAQNQRTVSARVVVDTIAPQVVVLNPLQDRFYNTSDIEVRWEVVDMSDVEASIDLDGGGFISIGDATDHLLTGLADGRHKLVLRVTDAASHSDEEEVSFTIDLVAPEVSVLSPGRYLRSTDLTVVLSANGTGSPLGLPSVRLDGGLWTNLDPHIGPNDTLEFELLGLEETDHTLSFDVPDMAGNHWYGTLLVTIDVTSPTVLSALPIGNGIRTDTEVSVEVSEALGTEGFEFVMWIEGARTVTVDGTMTWEGTTMTFAPDARLTPATKYGVRIEGRDLAGNGFMHSWDFETASKGTISGRIIDENGEPVVGASLILDTGETATTGQDGRFSIGSTQGNRTVTVTYKGKVIDNFKVDVTAGAEHDVGDRSVNLPIEDEGHEPSFPWQLTVLLAVLVVLVVFLLLYLFARRRRAEDEGDEEWGMEEEEEWGITPEE